MAFGSSVAALIETYSNCISLLKAFKRRGADARHDDQQSQLRRSLRSDRAQVRRAYSSALSESGSRFERGDARAKSSLGRVLKKLTSAITNILRSAGKVQPGLDYGSLVLLSNASRAEAIKAFDQLSRRLDSGPSRTSVASAPTASKHKRKHRSSSSTASSKNGRSGPSKEPSGSTQTPQERGRTDEQKWRDDRKKLAGLLSAPVPALATPPVTAPTAAGPQSWTPSGPSRTAVSNRISFASVSTDSTKLGEIPQRKLRLRYAYDSTSEEYNVPPVFPLKPYETPVKEKKFLGLFRRRT